MLQITGACRAMTARLPHPRHSLPGTSDMRPIRHIAIALLLGLLTTVASALALAAWMPMEMYPRQSNYTFIAGDRPWSGGERRTRGMWNIWWNELNDHMFALPPSPEEFLRDSVLTLIGRPPARDPALPQTAEEWIAYYQTYLDKSRDRRTVPILEFNHPPSWGTFARGRTPPDHVASGTDHGFGWPRPALWYRVDGINYFAFDPRGRVLSHASATGIKGGYILSGTLESRAYTFRALPHRIHWPGLLANTALFTLLWYLLLFAPGALRRTIRTRRNRCTTCGYDLRGLATSRCPECGTDATDKLKAPAEELQAPTRS